MSDLASTITDPWVRSAWGNCRGNSLVLQARYAEAATVLRATLADLSDFGLSFAMPHIEWDLAAAELGLRHFARCEGLLRRVERHPTFNRDLHLQLNVRALRARMSLAQQQASHALELTRDDFDYVPGHALMYGEYLATRALALATVGDINGAHDAALAAERITPCADVRILSAATRLVVALNGPSPRNEGAHLLRLASQIRAWDGVVCAVRAVPEALAVLAAASRAPRRAARPLDSF